MVGFALVVDAIKRPDAPGTVGSPADEREEDGVRGHPLLFAASVTPDGARHLVAVPERPEGEVEIVHHADVRMVTVEREKPRIGTLGVLPVEPERDDRELIAIRLRIVLPVDDETEPPPVAMGGEERPKDVCRLPLLRVKRSDREILLCGLLLVERSDLKRGGEEEISEHSSSVPRIRHARSLRARRCGCQPCAWRTSRESGPCGRGGRGFGR